jgi:hypothetical protein
MKRGGARPGAGRPGKTETQLKVAKETIRELNALMQDGLLVGAKQFKLLMTEELKTAQDMSLPPKLRMQARHYVMNLLQRSIGLRDEGTKTPAFSILDKWKITVESSDLAGDSEGNIIDTEHHALPGAS